MRDARCEMRDARCEKTLLQFPLVREEKPPEGGFFILILAAEH